MLHYAAESGNVEKCRYLVERGGMDPLRGDLELITPYDLAHQGGWKQLEAYFAAVVGAPWEAMYRNPIRSGMYPDPSICRVGEDYYMVNSTFVYFPCIPVSHSRDLVHWEIIGHAITRPEWANLEGLDGGRGYWAPDISYAEGRFYICATLRLNDGGTEYLPLTALKAYTGMRYVWNQNRNLGTLARGGDYYGFTAYSDSVIRGKTEQDVDYMTTTAKYQNGIHVCETYTLEEFGVEALYLSGGSYGCTMGGANCQNCSIACGRADTVPWRPVSPKELVETALELQARDPRVTGLAFTYNEPLCGWEYVRDAGRLAHRAGLANVLVSNGMANPPIVAELLEVLDAANIDLKAWSDSGYRQLGGDLGCVKETIATLAACPTCHLEVTTLLVPGLVSVSDVAEMARWLAGLDPAIPYHVTRFFPAHRMAHASPTPVKEVYEAAEAARKAGLAHVYTGNC